MTALEKAKLACEKADRRADVMRNRMETLRALEQRRTGLKQMKQDRKSHERPTT